MIKIGKLDWRLSDSDIINTPLDELNGRGLGGSFLSYWRKRKPDDFQGTATQYMLEILKPSINISIDEQIIRLKDAKFIPFEFLSREIEKRLVVILSRTVKVIPRLLGALDSLVPLDELGGKNLNKLYQNYARLKSPDDPRSVGAFISDELGLSDVTLEEELESFQFREAIQWRNVSKRTARHLTKRLYGKTGKWNSEDMMKIPMEEITYEGRDRSLGGIYAYYDRIRRENRMTCSTLEFMLAELGILGDQHYEGSDPVSPTA